MRRGVLILFGVLLSGVMINIAVAWAIALRSEPTWSTILLDEEPAERIVRFTAESPRSEGQMKPDHRLIESWGEIIIMQHAPHRATRGREVNALEFRRMLPAWSVLHDRDPAAEFGQTVDGASIHYEYASGWPRPALRGREHFTIIRDWDEGTLMHETLQKRGMLALPGERRAARHRATLPLLPIASVFAANTLLYSAAVAMAVMGIAALKQARYGTDAA